MQRALCGEPALALPHSLMMGFTADYQSGEIKVQDDELVAAGFFEADQLPRLPPRHHSAAADRAEPRREAVRARP